MGWIGDFISGAFGFASDKAKQKKEDQWRTEDQEREDTSYQRTVHDMMAAGLNPSTMNGLDGGALSESPSSYEQTNSALEQIANRSNASDINTATIDAEKEMHNADIAVQEQRLKNELLDIEEKIRSNKATEEDRKRQQALQREINAIEKGKLKLEHDKEKRRETEEREKRWNNVITKGAIDPALHSESVGLSKIANISQMNGSEGSKLEDLGINTGALSGFVKEKKLDVSDWIDTRQYIDRSSNQNIGNALVFRDGDNAYYVFIQQYGKSKPTIYHYYNYNEIQQYFPDY